MKYSLAKSVLAVIVLVFLAVSCQRKDTSAPKRLRLALDWMINPTHIPIFVGTKLGYFQDEGIQLEINLPGAIDPLDLLEEGQTELALSYLPRILRACSKDRQFYVVGKVIEKPLNGFLFLKESGIKRPEDFNGRVMGYCPLSASSASFDVLLNEKDIQIGCKMNLGNDLLSDLASKKIDVVYGAFENVEPERLKVLGYNPRFLSVTDFGMPDYEELIVVAHKRLQKKKRVLDCFQKALQKSLDFCRERPEMAFELYVEELQNNHKILGGWEEKSWQATLPCLACSQKFSYGDVKKLSDWLRDRGLMRKSVGLEPIFCSLGVREPEPLMQLASQE